MPQLLEQQRQRQRISKGATTAPRPIGQVTPTGVGVKSASMALAILGLVGVSFGIALAPTFQPQAIVMAPSPAPSSSYRMDLVEGYTDQGPDVTGSKSSQYQSQVMKTGSIQSLRSVRPSVSSPTPSTNNIASPVKPQQASPQRARPVTPFKPITPPAQSPTPKPSPSFSNPFDSFMGSMSGAMANGLGAIGLLGSSGAKLVGNVAGAGVKVGNAAMNVTGQVADNIGNNTSSALNNAAQNVANFQPLQNTSPGNAPTPQLDGGGGGGNPGGGGGNPGGSPGMGSPGVNSGEPNYGGDSTAQGGDGPCGKPSPCEQPPSPCEQNTSFSSARKSFIKR